jgi:hypothetical protein
MKLREISVSSRAARPARQTIRFSYPLHVVLFSRPEDREAFSEALYSVFRAPSEAAEPKRRLLSGRRQVLRRSARWSSVYVVLETSDGRRAGLLRDVASGRLTSVDLDSGRPDHWSLASILDGLDPSAFEALSRIEARDAAQAAAEEGAARALSKSLFLVRSHIPLGHGQLVPRAKRALLGERAGESPAPFAEQESEKDRARALAAAHIWKAREKAAEDRLLNARETDRLVQSTLAELQRCRQRIAAYSVDLAQRRYLRTRARYKQLRQKVERLDDLQLQLAKLEADEAPEEAYKALHVAPQVEKLLAAKAELEDRVRSLKRFSVEIGVEDGETRDSQSLVVELEALRKELALIESIRLPDAATKERIEKAYAEWRRLAADAEAARYAAQQAHLDAEEIRTVPPEPIQRLASTTTADCLRKLLDEWQHANERKKAACEKHKSALAKLDAAGIDRAEALELIDLLRRSATRAAELEWQASCLEEAKKTAALVPTFKTVRRRKAEQAVEAAAISLKFLLAQEGFLDFDAWRSTNERARELGDLLRALEESTFDIAESSRAVSEIEAEISERTGGLSAQQCEALVEELASYQDKLAEAAEYSREEAVARAAARRLEAARDAAATRFLAYLRPLGMVEEDPAKAWSKLKLVEQAGKKRAELLSRIEALEKRLESDRYRSEELYSLEKARTELDARLMAVLRSAGAVGESLEELLADFATLREAALLDKKLRAARARLRDQLEAASEGRNPLDWRKELLAVEAELSEVESSHPKWRKLETTAPEATLEAEVRTFEQILENLRKQEAELLSRYERLVESMESSMAALKDLEETRKQQRRLRWLADRWDEIEIGERRIGFKRLEEYEAIPAPAMVAAAAGGEISRLSSAKIPASTRSARPSYAHVDPIRPGSSVRAIRSVAARIPSGSARGSRLLEPLRETGTFGSQVTESPTAAWFLARLALAFAGAPAEEPLPIVVDGALDNLVSHDKPVFVDILAAASAAGQIVVLTSDPDLAALGESRGASTTEVF